MGKRAQVTSFIIVALAIIIILGILFFSINAPKIKSMLSSTNKNLKEIEPIKSYIEKTIQDLVIEGIFLIGKQGGKIYLTTWPDCKQEDTDYDENHRMCNQQGDLIYAYPSYLGSSPYKYKRIAVGINDSRHETWTQADRTSQFFPLEQPFAYLHQGNSLSKNYLFGWDEPLPPIKREPGYAYSLEGELSNWTMLHLPEVLDFSYFEKIGYDINIEGKPTVKASVNENDVTVNVNYTIHIKKADTSYELNEFYTSIPYNFRRFYRFVKDVIQRDIFTLDPIWNLKMYDETGEIISKVQVLESIPPSYKYDVINVTDKSLDFQLMYNTEEKYFSFYFIRENRAPDAGTVFFEPAEPMHIAEQNKITWYCYNYENYGTYFDPDEDDQFHKDPFPFYNPQWYHWYSRGDYLKTTNLGYCANSPPGCPVYAAPVQFHNEPNNKEKGVSWISGLTKCGNELPTFTTDSVNDDVGDVIILKVGDQMDYPIGPAVTAPSWYKQAQIIESGTGRLNDATSFRPVHCDPGFTAEGTYRTCTAPDNYWNFLEESTPPKPPETRCIQQCQKRQWNSCKTGHPPRFLGDPDTCQGGCEDVNCFCNKKADFIWVIDQKGELQIYPSQEPGTETAEVDSCNSDYGSGCRDSKTDLACGTPTSKPSTGASPNLNAPFKPICCASEDGVCHDINKLVSETGCGKKYPKWTLITEDDFCNQRDECQKGCCTIRGKNLEKSKHKYECVATCVDAGVCKCTGNDLTSCTGDYGWRKGEC